VTGAIAGNGKDGESSQQSTKKNSESGEKTKSEDE
jgi:hypothetical protein